MALKQTVRNYAKIPIKRENANIKTKKVLRKNMWGPYLLELETVAGSSPASG